MLRVGRKHWFESVGLLIMAPYRWWSLMDRQKVVSVSTGFAFGYRCLGIQASSVLCQLVCAVAMLFARSATQALQSEGVC